MTSPCLKPAPEVPAYRLPERFRLHHIDQIGSTNDEATKMAHAGAPSGTVVMADRQTDGRGRLGRTWISPPGNLYASVIWRPDCSLNATTGLSLLTGVALGEALADLGPDGLDLALKWPNDILVDGAKAAGILLENAQGNGARAAFVVIGTGVNIQAAPTEVSYPTTCLAHAGFQALSPFDLLAVYIEKLEIWLDRWQRDGFAGVRDAWRDKAYGLGGPIRLRLAREEIDGVFVDLTEGGALLIEQPDGRRREIAAGDVVYPDR